MLTVIAATLIVGGLIRLATDEQAVEVMSFRENETDPSAFAASLQPLSLTRSEERDGPLPGAGTQE